MSSALRTTQTIRATHATWAVLALRAIHAPRMRNMGSSTICYLIVSHARTHEAPFDRVTYGAQSIFAPTTRTILATDALRNLKWRALPQNRRNSLKKCSYCVQSRILRLYKPRRLAVSKHYDLRKCNRNLYSGRIEPKSARSMRRKTTVWHRSFSTSGSTKYAATPTQCAPKISVKS